MPSFGLEKRKYLDQHRSNKLQKRANGDARLETECAKIFAKYFNS